MQQSRDAVLCYAARCNAAASLCLLTACRPGELPLPLRMGFPTARYCWPCWPGGSSSPSAHSVVNACCAPLACAVQVGRRNGRGGRRQGAVAQEQPVEEPDAQTRRWETVRLPCTRLWLQKELPGVLTQ